MLGFDALAKLPLASLPQVEGTSETLTLDAATLSFTGQTIPLAITNVLGSASVSFTGQASVFAITHVLGQAALSFSGQAVVFALTHVLDPATLTFTGQGIPLDRSVPLSDAAISFAGQAETFALNFVLDQGSLAFAGQSIDLTRSLPLDPAAPIVFTGQAGFDLVRLINVTAGSIAFSSQAIALLSLEPTAARRRFFIAPSSSRLGGLWKGRS